MVSKTDCAIWDLQLWRSDSVNLLMTAEDSGLVKAIDPRNTKEQITVYEGIG